MTLLLKFLSKLRPEKLIDLVFELLKRKTLEMSPSESLTLLFDLEHKIYILEGQESVRYGNGIHTKHKHIRYHDFFIQNIPEKSRVLDIGCGKGELAADISDNVRDVFVFGIDINPNCIDIANNRFSRENVTYVLGDALKDLPSETFDIVILSNVLEHLDKRVTFLRKTASMYKPNKVLIRVPVFERDWRVPLKKELGIDYRLDATHFIEYRYEELFEELKQSGLSVTHYKINWGEIWAEAIIS